MQREQIEDKKERLGSDAMAEEDASVIHEIVNMKHKLRNLDHEDGDTTPCWRSRAVVCAICGRLPGKLVSVDHDHMRLERSIRGLVASEVQQGYHWYVPRTTVELPRRCCSHILRSAISHARVSLVAVFSDGKLLLGKRRDNGKWTLPGGHLEEGRGPDRGRAPRGPRGDRLLPSRPTS
jgi:hypothetical protein